MSQVRYILLYRVIDGVGIELRNAGEVEIEHLALFSTLAKEQGFDLMFEFSSPPDMKEAARLAKEHKLSAMSDMVRLWALVEETPP